MPYASRLKSTIFEKRRENIARNRYEELIQSEKELVKIVDFMGRETVFKPNTPMIYIYSDGTRERVMKLEE